MTRSHLPSTAASAASRPVTFAWMSLRTRYLMASVSSEARAAHYRRHAPQMHSTRRAINGGAVPIEYCQAERIGRPNYKRQNLGNTRVDHPQDSRTVAEVVPQRSVTPRSVINFVVAQCTDARV